MVGANMLVNLGNVTNRLIHLQPRRLQDRHAVTQTADILSQKAGAHFLLPALEVKMIPGTKRSRPKTRNITFF
jgi:hypothetical protein